LKENEMVRFIAFNLFVFFVSVYLFTTSANNICETDASRARYELTKSIVERFDLSIPDGLGFKGADGKDYSWYGIAFSALAVPFYFVGKLAGVLPENAVSIMNQLFGAATAVLVFLFSIALGYSKRASLSVAIFYGLGTMAWPLAKQPFDHTIETFFILFSVYSMYLYVVDRKVSHLLFSAFSLGIAFITRPTSILVIPSLFILLAVYYSKRHDFKTTARMLANNIILFSLVLLPFIALNLWYNYYRFGSVFETGYSLIAARTGIDFFTGTPLLTGIRGFLISPGKGFFYYSPVAILFFFSIKSFIKKHPGLGFSFIIIMVSYLLFLSKNIYWHGDWAWGPRYILALTPFFIIPLAELFDSDIWLKENLRRLALSSIFILSLIVQIAAVSVDFNKYFFDLMIEEKVEFTIVHGDGIQPIREPPDETYFDWRKSPILSHFRFIYKMIGNIKDYRYSMPPEDASVVEKIKADPTMNVFDFWWVYRYFLDNNYSGFIVALLLFLVIIFYASRLWRVLRDS
jgi:4-amino-4-deoxy-L-arabinose transferase-like glycosyltransferase